MAHRMPRNLAAILPSLVLWASTGSLACTYNFDKFEKYAGQQDAPLAVDGPSAGDDAIVPESDSRGTDTPTVVEPGNADARPSEDSNAMACSGVLRSGICWYLGPQGSSCQQVCASHGQLAPTATSHIGTTSQGGSLTECASLLKLLGVSGTPASGTRSDGLGLGCHVFQGNALWWLTSPNFSASASQASAQLVCGCNN